MNNNSGILYIVATPIGNLQDISLRALETLKQVDLIAAEDTRQSSKLLQHYGITTSMLSLYDYNEEHRSEVLLTKLKGGKNIALISDAGTPLISDPGYRLVKAARDANIKVVPIPGACAAITALSAAGLPTDHFIFAGFLPAKATLRKQHLTALQHETRTMIFYEAPQRIVDSLTDMLTIFGGERIAVIAREITKIFETIHSAPLKELLTWVASDRNQQKGEIVILVAGKTNAPTHDDQEAERILKILLTELPGSQAVKLATKILGKETKKKELYQMMLGMDEKSKKLFL